MRNFSFPLTVNYCTNTGTYVCLPPARSPGRVGLGLPHARLVRVRVRVISFTLALLRSGKRQARARARARGSGVGGSGSEPVSGSVSVSGYDLAATGTCAACALHAHGMFCSHPPYPDRYLIALALNAGRQCRASTPAPASRDLRLSIAIGVITALDIGASNAGLTLLSVSFHTVIRGAIPGLVLIFALIARLEKPEVTRHPRSTPRHLPSLSAPWHLPHSSLGTCGATRARTQHARTRHASSMR